MRIGYAPGRCLRAHLLALSPVERIALQACIGSDPKRELFSLFDHWAGENPCAVLFELPPEPAAEPLPLPDCPIDFSKGG